ncbi:TlpA family protein disulfide reductase [Aquimarina aquimarini]|uniref:TlpA family protein disulfide reductase n=1 Tax=Aquimarina aquimarini TaxID=1191734 RepID=UPI000D55CDFC|nr:TlpA disulfide reductase family protein [Aquimarina aquimarini]
MFYLLKFKYYFLVLFTAIAFSCKSQPDTEIPKTVVSGIIEDYSTKVFTINGQGIVTKKITLDDANNFKDTLTLKEGFYSINLGAYYSIPVYIISGKDISFTMNFRIGKPSLIFSGEGGAINNFIQKKASIYIDSDKEKELYGLNEDEFLAELNSKKNTANILIDATDYSETFKKIEKKNIEYEYFDMVRSYPFYNSKYIGKTHKDIESELSKYYPKTEKVTKDFMDTTNFDNSEDYKNSITYKRLVKDFFYKKIIEKIGGYEYYKTKFMDAAIAEIKTYKSNDIKDDLLWEHPIRRSLVSSNPNFEKRYTEIIDIITSPSIKEYVEKRYQEIKKLVPGNPAPEFTYEDVEGNMVSLSDFKGKYVYIDIWGTWCGPCKQEIPFLKKLEERYRDKNIEFLSVSVKDKKETWKEFVKKENLKGTQLYEEQKSKMKITELYKIPGYPTFILVNPEGKIVSAHAMRPSNPEINTYFETHIK